MRITINEFVLAEMSGPVGVRDFKVSHERLMEQAQFLRAAASAFFDRKNQATTITFAVTRLHASVRDAEVFLLAHEAEVPAGGLVTFTARGDNGQEIARYLDAALVEVAESAYVGCSSTVIYRIKGGLLLRQQPV